MKTKLLYILLPFVGFTSFGASFVPGDLAVLQVGDGSAALNNSSTALFIREFTTLGLPIQTFGIPTGGGSEMTLSGTATSEGQLTRSSDGTLLTFSGYATAPGLAGVAGTTAAAVNRGVGALSLSGLFSRVATGSTLAMDGNNPRGATSDGVNYWFSGTGSGTGSANGGVWYSAGGGAPTQVRGGNLRQVNIFGGNLYFSSSAAAPGVGLHSFSGLPTGSATSSLLFAIAGGSPYDFALSPSGDVAYVADDRSGASGGGIQRWNFSAGSWSLAYTLAPGLTGNDGTRQLTVDFSGLNPVIYATTTEASANRLVSVTDVGAGSPFLLLATAGANTVFRGVDFTPIPEPAGIGLLALGGLALGLRRRMRG